MITPLTATTVAVINNWLTGYAGLLTDPLFRTRLGTPMSRDAIERRMTKHTRAAARTAPTLAEKKISPHVLRHYVDGVGAHVIPGFWEPVAFSVCGASSALAVFD